MLGEKIIPACVKSHAWLLASPDALKGLEEEVLMPGSGLGSMEGPAKREHLGHGMNKGHICRNRRVLEASFSPARRALGSTSGPGDRRQGLGTENGKLTTSTEIQWRGDGNRAGSKGAGEGKHMERRRLEITFSILLKFLCNCHFEELLPTCRWRADGSEAAVLGGSEVPAPREAGERSTEERGGRVIKYSLYSWQPSYLPLARFMRVCSECAPAGEGTPALLTLLVASRRQRQGLPGGGMVVP